MSQKVISMYHGGRCLRLLGIRRYSNARAAMMVMASDTITPFCTSSELITTIPFIGDYTPVSFLSSLLLPYSRPSFPIDLSAYDLLSDVF